MCVRNCCGDKLPPMVLSPLLAVLAAITMFGRPLLRRSHSRLECRRTASIQKVRRPASKPSAPAASANSRARPHFFGALPPESSPRRSCVRCRSPPIASNCFCAACAAGLPARRQLVGSQRAFQLQRCPANLTPPLERFGVADGTASFPKIQRIVCVAASHHRLLWIQPFSDGNAKLGWNQD